MAPRRPRLPAGYRADWALFCDWCDAVGEDPLPAATATLVTFLEAHPAATGTQRRRFTAIRAAHTREGWPAPGLAAADGRFVERHREPAGPAHLRHVVAALPTAGWPAGLLGRRDALLLVLSQVVGLTFTRVERLQRSDVHIQHVPDGGHLLVVTTDGRRWQVPAEQDPRSCPVAVYLRWARLRSFFDKRPSTAALAAALRREPVLTVDSAETYESPAAPRDEGPLLPEIDRWGGIEAGRFTGMGQPRLGVSARTCSRLVQAHLAGSANPYVLTAPRPVVPLPQPEPAPEPAPLPDSDPHVGLQKRAKARGRLDVVDDLLETVGSSVDELDARIRAILDADAGRGGSPQ